jgi:hypothetical protein
MNQGSEFKWIFLTTTKNYGMYSHELISNDYIHLEMLI